MAEVQPGQSAPKRAEGYATAPANTAQAQVWAFAGDSFTPGNNTPWIFSDAIVRRVPGAHDAGKVPIQTLDNQLVMDNTGFHAKKAGDSLDTATMDYNGLKVQDQSGNLKTSLGNITGLAGVPSGTQYGLWGALGSGVYIQGAPRLVAAGAESNLVFLDTAPAAGDVETFSGSDSIHGAWSIPAGKQWLVVVSVYQANTDVASSVMQYEALAKFDSLITPVRLGSASGSAITVAWRVDVCHVKAYSGLGSPQANLVYAWMILEVDQ